MSELNHPREPGERQDQRDQAAREEAACDEKRNDRENEVPQRANRQRQQKKLHEQDNKE